MPILSKVLTHYDPYTLQQLTDTWSYVLNTPNGGVSNSVTNPDGSTATYYAYMEASLGSGLDGHTFKVDRSDSRGSLLDRTEQYWQFNVDPYGQTGVSSQQINPFVRAEFRSIAPANSTTPTLSAIAINTEDVNGNITRVDESDWVDYKTVTILTHGVETDIEQLPSISPARTTINSYYMLADAGSNVGNAYWRTTAPLILNAKTSTEIETSGVPTAYSEFDYDDPTGAGTNTTSGAGNVFHEWRWDSTRLLLFPGAVSSGGGSGTLSSSNAIVTTRTYAHGDLLTETDPRGNPTSLQYNDPAHPYPTDLFEADGEHWQFTWDIPSGLRISETDPNNGTTTAQYWPRGRTKSIVSSDSAGSVTYRQAITTYDDSVQTTLVQKDLNKVNDGKVQTATATDDLGHVWKTLSTDGSCPTQIQTIHLQQTLPKGQQPPLDGYSYQLVSNPFCSTSDATMGWTRTQLDPLGRVTQVAHFTGSALPAPWGSNNTTSGIIQTKYDSNQYTVTDEAGVSRTLSTDGFNRLSSALDGTGVTASYTYDALGNLTSVAQGSQSRTVLYTSLGQLKSATNPENGTIAYTYDDNGNLATRTDARGVIATLSTSSYPYDRLNRVVLKSYSDGTPSVTYCYDGNIYGGSPGQCSAGTGFVNPVGHLTQVTSSVSNTTYTNYDLAGRIISSTQNTNGTPYPFSYAYL